MTEYAEVVVMRREGGSPRRGRRSLSALLPAALLVSVLLAAPVLSSPIARPGVYPARTVATPAEAPASAAVSRHDAATARRPGWSVPREAVEILVVSYVGIGAVAAAGIWSYVRRGRW